MATALDYLGEDRVFVCAESMRIRERVKNYTNELTEDIKSLMEEGVLSAQQTEFCASWEAYLAAAQARPCVLLERALSAPVWNPVRARS